MSTLQPQGLSPEPARPEPVEWAEGSPHENVNKKGDNFFRRSQKLVVQSLRFNLWDPRMKKMANEGKLLSNILSL